MTELEVARHAANIARKACAWTADSLIFANGEASDDVVIRFIADIQQILDCLAAELAPRPTQEASDGGWPECGCDQRQRARAEAGLLKTRGCWEVDIENPPGAHR